MSRLEHELIFGLLKCCCWFCCEVCCKGGQQSRPQVSETSALRQPPQQRMEGYSSLGSGGVGAGGGLGGEGTMGGGGAGGGVVGGLSVGNGGAAALPNAPPGDPFAYKGAPQ